MTSTTPSRRIHVLLAAAVVVLLAGVLGVRLFATSPGVSPAGSITPGPASVPVPTSFDGADLKVPNWGHRDALAWSVDYRTNLDLLAPLGTGETNAALWFKDFTKEPAGSRLEESIKAMDARAEGPVKWLEKVFPSDHPLLLEAEPWCNQAAMDFYPEFLEPDGWRTAVPNLLVPLALARSWVARGLASEDEAAAVADFRRAIRLGRLLRQEGAVVITDLVGLACIDAGARGIYEVAVRHGDFELALLASVVVGEHGPLRLMTRLRLADFDAFDVTRPKDGEGLEFRVSNKAVGKLIERATSDPDARFRNEAIILLGAARQFGTVAQRQEVVEALTELLGSEEEMVAENARWALESDTGEDELAGLFELE